MEFREKGRVRKIVWYTKMTDEAWARAREVAGVQPPAIPEGLPYFKRVVGNPDVVTFEDVASEMWLQAELAHQLIHAGYLEVTDRDGKQLILMQREAGINDVVIGTVWRFKFDNGEWTYVCSDYDLLQKLYKLHWPD